MTTTAAPIATTSSSTDLSLTRLYLLRAGYLFMGGGLALVKWPLLGDAHTMPLYEGVTLCLLTAMSLLALVGLKLPVAMLPVLLLEVTWKLIWLGLVALPASRAGDLDPAMSEVLVNCSFVVVIIAVIPWRHVWRAYVRAGGARWR
ncbi:hypothetical protein [Nocardioides sp.]|uniref:hypothetical protein n=1 Tax=Nocardioides sp. TaxID=35761 RepID=UPI002ED2227C